MTIYNLHILDFYCYHHFSLVFIFNYFWKFFINFINPSLDILVGEQLQSGGVSVPDILYRLRLRYFPFSRHDCGRHLKAKFMEEIEESVRETREELAVELQCFLKGRIALGWFARSLLNKDDPTAAELVRNSHKYLPQIRYRKMVDCSLDEKFVIVNLSLRELFCRLTNRLNVGNLIPDPNIQHFPHRVNTNHGILQLCHGRDET